MADLEFSLKLKEKPVVIIDADGVRKNYTLRELSGRQRGKYFGELGDRMEFDEQGRLKRVKNYEGLESSLLSRCLYDENNQLVKREVIEDYPASVLAKLFEAAQELSGLGGTAEADAKNS